MVNQFKELLLHLHSRDFLSIRRLSRAAHPGTNFSTFLKRRKFECRLFVFYRFHLELQALFENDPLLHEIAHTNPRIYEKIYRRYLFNSADIPQRLQMLISNYQFVRDTFSIQLVRAVFVYQNFSICRINLPDELGEIVAKLTYIPRFGQEGEFTLGLYDSGGKRLYSVSFSFGMDEGSPYILIGCIQGPDNANEREGANGETIKKITKGMHGLRPKTLVINLLQIICRYFGVYRLYAVTSRSHIYSGTSKHCRIKSDYDSFWQELGGVRVEQDLFSLPLHQSRKSFDDIRTNKRATYRRRYTLLDDIENQFYEALNNLLLGPSLFQMGSSKSSFPAMR